MVVRTHVMPLYLLRCLLELFCSEAVYEWQIATQELLNIIFSCHIETTIFRLNIVDKTDEIKNKNGVPV